jgi:hypothetical protein
MGILSRVVYFGFFLLLFITTPASGASQMPVINEIAWMGTAASPNDEWIELFNPADSAMSLEGWILKTDDGKIKIDLKGSIPARGFYLLERTDDSSVPGRPADLIYKGALGNNGENLKLFDGSGNLIDRADCSAEWFAGSNAAKLTMERIDYAISGNKPDNWQNSKDPGGSPKIKNSRSSDETATPANDEEAKENKTTDGDMPTQTQPLPSWPDGIIINEIMPSPEGPDEQNEWIEICNQNKFEVDLSGWQIKDSQGVPTIFTIPAGTKISGSNFLVFTRPVTKITLNNDNDRILIVRPDGQTADSANYQKAVMGKSYNLTDDGWRWLSPTPGQNNQIVFPEAGEQMQEKADSGEEEMAAASQPFQISKGQQKSGSSLILLAALTISLFSGILILSLKKKIASMN